MDREIVATLLGLADLGLVFGFFLDKLANRLANWEYRRYYRDYYLIDLRDRAVDEFRRGETEDMSDWLDRVNLLVPGKSGN